MELHRWFFAAMLCVLTSAQNQPFNQFSTNSPPFPTTNRNYDQYSPADPSFNGPPPQSYPRPGDGFGKQDQYGSNDPYGRFDNNNRPRPQYDYANPNQLDGFEHRSIIREATYFIVASRMVRPGQLYRVSATILREKAPLIVRASIHRNGVEMSAEHKSLKQGIPETLLMRVPTTSAPGEYKLRVEGLYDNVLGGSAFVNESKLVFSQRSMTIFIQLDKPVYMQGQTVRFRTIPINTELKSFENAIDVYMLDPSGHIMKRWLSRQSNLGTVSLDYQLSDQPVFGEWKIKVVAQGQIEESTFLVEEYYQTRFEVNVTMPAFFFTNEEYIYGTVMANYTSGAPVRGNLTLKATIRPIKPLQQTLKDLDKKLHRNRPGDEYDFYEYENYGGSSSYNQHTVEKYFTFEEEYPFWTNIADYYSKTPHLNFFYGAYNFKYPIRDLLHHVPTLENMEVIITATVGDRFLDEVIEGHSIARMFNSSIKLAFLGDSPQVFKPGMPTTAYIVASFHDGSPLEDSRLLQGTMEIHTSIDRHGGARLDLPTRTLKMSDDIGVWQYHIDLKYELELEGVRKVNELNDIKSIRMQAFFRDAEGGRADADLLMLTHYSPDNQHLKVSTSTISPRVGEYIILHIRSNYYVPRFNYMIVAKGIVLLTGDEVMEDSVATMAVTLSAEMAPVATVVVWHVGKYGEVTADSLTFPVNGISRNHFSVFINNKKARTGHKVEIAIYGEPGAYVGLSGIDNAFYTMQAGNELTYAKVITKMASFEEGSTNGTLQHTWFSHEGDPDELVYYPSSSYGIDANRTFAYSGLIVFSDIEVPRRRSQCDESLGMGECLSGQCYNIRGKCNGIRDCEDGTDESGCVYNNGTEMLYFRKYRFSRIQRQYENVWLWKDCNIGPHGRFIFNIDVPARPAHWMVSAFSMSPTMGFGMINQPIEYVGVLPFFINVEMPTSCMQGEQVGVRVSVFNYMTSPIEATVVLNGSPDYKFVHVEEDGIVVAYNPRTTFGEHQFFVYIKAQDVAVVYLPIVPTRLGDIDVTVHATALIGKDQITKRIRVEADGIPQYRHQSMLLDLSNRAYAFQYMHVNVTETPIIPYEYDRYYVYGSNKAKVSIVGDVVGPIFPTMPVNATSLLYLPMDSAEQNIFGFAANMYTTLYMRYAIQRNKTLEREAFYHMNIAYQKQLSFMQPDGSFSFFRSDWNQSMSSVWLTAHCARILQEASFYEWENYIYIDPVVISKAVEWVLKHQGPEGAFYEVTWLADRKYNNTFTYSENDPYQHRNITLTAHVVIMLETVKDLSSGLSSKVSIAQMKALNWLEKNMKLLEQFGNPFDISIVAYALMKSKANNAETAFNLLARNARLEGGLMYWSREQLPQPPYKIENQKPFLLPRLPYKYDSENIEATAYGLMIYVARQEILVDNIVRWLNTQRLTDGGWASTIDTAHAMKALIEYTAAQRIRDISSLSVTVEATALAGQTKVLHVNDKNRAQLQSIEIPEAWGTVKVQAKGTGYAILQMSVQYNVDIAKFQTQPPEPAFDLWTRADFYGRNHSHISYYSCQRWNNLNESERSGMAVLDIAIPTGYIVQQQKLDAYILSKKVRNLQRAKFLERKVLFYFDYLDEHETCINLTVERWYPVANMSRFLPIRVYDYYAPERFNETIFDSLTTYLLNICEVCGSSQCPYCYIYNSAFATPVPFFTIFFASFFVVFRYLWSQNAAVI
ncbi:PREDICTED: CD109 antigen isoform X2 [Nicrophorus vespilloides]|nr:PREDICTED: CD109 antigen isoform X2 [Nicrophorus vespilloides]XP_017785161.1 PREDICTED: CD109 antigen isoform X2 [Nicrophorus vespilloides]